MAELIFVSGPEKGRTYTLESPKTVIGREIDCECAVQGTGVSRRHCAVTKQGDGYQIEDLKSTNGTLVNGRVVSQTEIKNNDTIEIGEVQMAFQAEARR